MAVAQEEIANMNVVVKNEDDDFLMVYCAHFWCRVATNSRCACSRPYAIPPPLVIAPTYAAAIWKDNSSPSPPKSTYSVFVFTSICILFRLWIMNFQGPEFSPSGNPAAHENLFLTRFLTFSFLPFFNTKLLILPHHLSFDWSMDAIPLLYSCWDPRTFLSLIFYVVLGYNSVKLIKICNRNVASPSPTFDINDNPLKSIPNNNNSIIRPLCSEPKCAAPIKNGYKLKFKGSNLVLLSDYSYLSDTVLFGIVITVITFLPATNLLTYVGFVVAERVLYLPSVGYCMMVAAGMERLMVSKRYKKLVTVMSLLLLIAFAAKTVKRNKDWKNEENLYSSGITVNSAKAYSNLGNVLSRQDRNDEAETAYKNALKYRPNMADTHYNLCPQKFING